MHSELYKAVQSINYDILEHDENCKKGYYEHLLQFHSDGCINYVKFLGNIIYCDDDNDREWYEETNSYEPFQPYLLRKMSKEISKLKEIESLLLRPSENSLDKQD